MTIMAAKVLKWSNTDVLTEKLRCSNECDWCNAHLLVSAVLLGCVILNLLLVPLNAKLVYSWEKLQWFITTAARSII